MAIPVPHAKLGVGDSSGKAWKVTYDKKNAVIKIGYGTIFVNGKFFSTNNLLSGTVKTGIGTDQKVFLGASDNYIYLKIYNPLGLPTETDKNLMIQIDIEVNNKAPDGDTPINENAPVIQYIPLAYVDSTAKVFDLRPTWTINHFGFLAPGQPSDS